MEDIEYQKKQIDTYKMFLKIREEQAKKEKYKNYSQDGLIDELLEKQEENERLQDRINKAIEYIEKYKEIQAEFVYVNFDNEDLDKLLKILKGEQDAIL